MYDNVLLPLLRQKMNIPTKLVRIVIGTMKCSPTNAAQIEYVHSPLSLRIQYLSILPQDYAIFSATIRFCLWDP